MLSVYKLESVFNLTTPSFFSNCQDLDKSDNILVRFATLQTAMLANGLWAIKITNLIVGAKKFHKISSKGTSLAKIFYLIQTQVVRRSREGTLRCIKFASGQVNKFA